MVLRRACSAINQASDKLGVTLLTCMAIFAAARYFGIKKKVRPEWRRLYFLCRICGTGRWQKSGSNQPGCHNVQDIINRVTDEHAENNWSLCVLSAGAADANIAARAALHVQSVLRRDYDLMTD